MRSGERVLVGCLILASARLLCAQSEGLTVPKTVTAGDAFSIQSSGSGKGTLYIVGPSQVFNRDVQLGTTASFPAGSLYNAGHYLVILSGDSTATSSLDVVPAAQPANLTFLARPSRLEVNLQNGITGAVYVLDTYQNLIVASEQVSFELSSPAGETQNRTVATRYGAAWTAMNSSAHPGSSQFVARIGELRSARVIGLVAGEPCSIKMNARQTGQQLELETEPVRDCGGNAVPDGTIVTFKETLNGNTSTADVPLKRGIAKVDMPAVQGTTITVASGVVLGNQIRWEK